MRVLLLGATGRTGRRALGRLEAEGHEVTTFGRRPGGGTRALTGALDDAGAMARALEGTEAALSCLASSNREPVCSTATRTLIEAADGRPLRYAVVSGAGVDAEGDSKGLADRAAGALMRVVVGRMLADRQRELALLEDSPLLYTALRPPRLTEAPGAGAWRFTFDRPASLRIARDDLAGALAEALGRDDLARRAPFVAAPA